MIFDKAKSNGDEAVSNNGDRSRLPRPIDADVSSEMQEMFN
jgi:hypothetical protein